MDNINIFKILMLSAQTEMRFIVFNKSDLCLCTAFFTERSDVI